MPAFSDDDPCLQVGGFAAHAQAKIVPPPRVAVGSPSFLMLPESTWKEPELWRLLVRDANGEPPPDNYIHNQMQALIDAFDPWMREGRGTFREMMEAMHRIGCVGADGKTPYFSKADGRSSDGYNPGKMRDRLRTMDGLLFDDLSPLKMDIPPKSTEGREIAEGAVALDGIDQASLPKNKRLRNGTWEHTYPNSRSIPKYLARMETLFHTLREIPRGDVSRRTELLNLLADYYQVGINAHLFSRVNNSLMMAQVNYLLEFHGLKGISHGDLDYQALSRPSADFRQLFTQTVMGAQ